MARQGGRDKSVHRAARLEADGRAARRPGQGRRGGTEGGDDGPEIGRHLADSAGVADADGGQRADRDAFGVVDTASERRRVFSQLQSSRPI